MRVPKLANPSEWGTLRHGSMGPDVAFFQATLEGYGYELTDHVGDFGDSTHNSTLAYQRLRQLKADAVVGDNTKATIGEAMPLLTRESLKPAEGLLSNIPMIQAKHWGHKYASRTTVNLIVLHSMESGESAVAAENVAKWFASDASPVSSAHYCIDSDSIVRCVREESMAWHARGGNRHSIGIEHAGRARQTERQWRDAFSEAMLERSAALVADIGFRWGIPLQYVDADDLLRGEGGITTHSDITIAHKKSTHTDPGKGFPMEWYVERANTYAEAFAKAR